MNDLELRRLRMNPPHLKRNIKDVPYTEFFEVYDEVFRKINLDTISSKKSSTYAINLITGEIVSFEEDTIVHIVTVCGLITFCRLGKAE